LDGHAIESGWPYIDSLPEDLTHWTPPSSAAPVFRRETTIASAEIDSIVRYLDAGIPVIAVFMASHAFCAAENGVVCPTSSDSDVDWHAVIAVGHALEGASRLFLVRNSWGSSWGLGGYAWVESEYLAPRLSGLVTMAPMEGA
jgi:C1A family cysteine protease